MRGERMPDRISQENVCNRTQFEFFQTGGQNEEDHRSRKNYRIPSQKATHARRIRQPAWGICAGNFKMGARRLLSRYHRFARPRRNAWLHGE